jgi:hypothetical protein
METKLNNIGRFLFAILLMGTFLLATDESWATFIRGRVDGRNGFSPALFPVQGTPVDVYQPGGLNGWIFVVRAFTGPDGMYFLNLPPGQYFLQIGGRINVPIVITPIPAQDIPPILMLF